MRELANLMGDESQGVIKTPKLATPHKLNVRVERRGVEVGLTIGNSDTIWLTWLEAMRLYDRLFIEGSRAVREKRPAELRLGHDKMQTSGRVLMQIANWLQAKAGECKFLDGAAGKVIETR